MRPEDATKSSSGGSAPSERTFTVESANAALVFVRKVVDDVVETYRELMRLRREREELAVLNGTAEQVTHVQREMEERVVKLNALHNELCEVGCQLKDWETGLVDFPAKRDGRTVLLCWRLGEEFVGHWHEVNSGFAGRQPIGGGFDESESAE